MGQEFSTSSSSASLSILEPLKDGPPSSPEEEQPLDEHLVRAIMAITESTTDPMHSNFRRSDRDTEVQLSVMRAEAEKDFAEWRRHKRAMKQLSRNDSGASTTSSLCYLYPN